MTLEEAWAAGLFDGEGSVSEPDGRLQLKMVDEFTVRRFHRAVGGLGTVYGPYKNRAGEKDGWARRQFYVWVARKSDARAVAEVLLPLLSPIRSDAIRAFHVER